jgi:hypothetical protein
MTEFKSDKDVENAILSQMVNTAGKEGKPDLDVSRRENVKNMVREEIKIPTLTTQALKFTLTQLKGVKFKFGEAVFEIGHINERKKKFTATLMNDVK